MYEGGREGGVVSAWVLDIGDGEGGGDEILAGWGKWKGGGE